MALLSATPPRPPAPSGSPSGPPPPPPQTGGLPPAYLPTGTSQTLPQGSVRLRIAHWMENRFGRAAMPMAALAGGIVGGGAGFLALGPVGGLVGAAGGAFFGAALFMSG